MPHVNHTYDQRWLNMPWMIQVTDNSVGELFWFLIGTEPLSPEPLLLLLLVLICFPRFIKVPTFFSLNPSSLPSFTCSDRHWICTERTHPVTLWESVGIDHGHSASLCAMLSLRNAQPADFLLASEMTISHISTPSFKHYRHLKTDCLEASIK